MQQTLEIKIDAQVMLIKNMDENLVNGSLGRVLGFYMASEICGLGGEVSSRGGNGFIRKVILKDDGKTPVGRKVMESENKSTNTRSKPKAGSQECTEKFPLMEFQTPLGKEIVLVARDEFKVEDNDGTVAARHVQVSSTSVLWILGFLQWGLDPVSSHLGYVNTQESRPDTLVCEGGPCQGFREG